jgi:hypothetical protein
MDYEVRETTGCFVENKTIYIKQAAWDILRVCIVKPDGVYTVMLLFWGR